MTNLNYVKTFADDVLKYATDTYHNPPSPLLADAYHKENKTHYRYAYGRYLECPDIVHSNMARQMNFMRVLSALSLLTGDERYQQVFDANFKYYNEHFKSPNGLFYWGGHRLVDLKSLTHVGEWNHELKNDYPAYKSLMKIDADATIQYIEAFWETHVYNWETLETSRHGDYNQAVDQLWDNHFADPEPFVEVKGLSFINTGSDLIFSACEYYKKTGNEKALLWVERLDHMYVKSRDPKTGLGVYQFNQPRATRFTDNFADTESFFGDRAKRQLGPELGETALEGNVLLESKTRTIYGSAALVFLHEARTLPKTHAGKVLLKNTLSGLESFAQYAYIPETNMFKPLMANGTDLTGFELRRDGYYGKVGNKFMQYKADGLFFLVFAKAAAMQEKITDSASEKSILWQTAAHIGVGLGFGDIHEDVLNLKTTSTCAYSLFAFINLYQLTGEEKYNDIAEVIASNITSGAFMGETSTMYRRDLIKSEYIWINSLEPLALLAQEASKKGMLDQIDTSIFY